MPHPPRKLGFVLAATDQGTLIVNRFDYKMVDQTQAFGVGHSLLNTASYEAREVGSALALLALRRRHFGNGVLAIDCGANIGVFTVEWAKAMTGWGSVLAIEAQQRVFYALAGNIALNNCFNAQAMHAAVTAETGVLRIPVPNYLSPGSFGSLELKSSEQTEFIGQTISYAEDRLVPIQAITIDSLNLKRLDLLKIDVERMELEVLAGARRTIDRHLPIILVEHLKTNKDALEAVLDSHGYRHFQAGLNTIAVHASDPTLNHLSNQP